MIVKPDMDEFGDDWAYGDAFIKQHEQEFGFTLPDRDIIVDDVRVRGIGKTSGGLEKTVNQQLKKIKPRDVTPDKVHIKSKVYFETRQQREETPIYKLEGLDVGDRIKGPAIIADGTQTIIVTPGAAALIIETHVVITIGGAGSDTGYVNPPHFSSLNVRIPRDNLKVAPI
jgi:5-oxoprolinase (ATP-hydrolysing)